jgi:hypothetical protein
VFFSVDGAIILHVATDIGGSVIILVIVMLLLLEKLKKSPLLFNRQSGLRSAVYRYPPTERRLSITITIIWGAASRWSEIF